MGQFLVGDAFAFIHDLDDYNPGGFCCDANDYFFIWRAVPDSVAYNVLDRAGERNGVAGDAMQSTSSPLAVNMITGKSLLRLTRAERVRRNYGGNFGRLVELKDRYDPGNLFHLNANVAPDA